MRFSFILIGLLSIIELHGQHHVLDGAFSESYSNGKVKLKGFYKSGKADSTWTFYFEDGQVYKTGTYKECIYELGGVKVRQYPIDHEWHEKGIENGTWKIFHKNGVLKAEYRSVCGIKVGLVRDFKINGLLQTESFYSNGELQFEKEFFDNGAVSKFTLYSYYNIKDDDKHSTRYFKTTVLNFYDTGELEELYHEDKNEIQGEYKRFWKNGFLQLESNYDNGDQDGVVIEYYDNGKMESETEYKEGRKHGRSILYSRDGTMTGNQIWENGVLKRS